jgi:hypothetical protein
MDQQVVDNFTRIAAVQSSNRVVEDKRARPSGRRREWRDKHPLPQGRGPTRVMYERNIPWEG